MANLPGHFSFQSSQDTNQMLTKDSTDGAAVIELNRDRRSQLSDDNSVGHFPRPLPHPDYDPCHSNVGLLKAELKAITNDRDILRRELNKMQNQLEGYKQLSAEKTAPSHNYEWLKSQCDQAMNELQSLKEQHSDTVRKCDNAMSQADSYKQQYEKMKQTNAVIRSQYAEAMVVRQHLEQEREELRRLSEADRREIDEFRKHQREVFGQSGSFEEFSVMYDTLVGRYDSLKQDYETLRKQSADSLAKVGAASAKVEELQEENSRMRKQNNTLYEESKMFQQHMSLSVQAGQDQKNLVQKIAKAQQEKETLAQQLSQALTDKLKEMKDASRLRAERNAITNEYKLVMSERDTVHKEMEHLHDVNSELNAKVVTLASEKSAALDEIGRLRRMLGNALETYHDDSDGVSLELEQEKVLFEFNRMLETTSSGREPTDPYMQNGKTKEMLMSYSRTGQDGGNSKETDNLRKELDKTQNELMDALHELEEAKQLRDWAFGERDKIVKERESIRTLCDKLRHERDSAVSELIGALRDSDELKRQKNDVMKELKELEEKYETLLEKEAHKNRLSTAEYSHSRDSAIDADLQEWETETLELDIGSIHSSDLGFDLVGGANDPQFPNDPSIFVRSIQPSSAAYGKLKVSDQLLRVNDIDVSCTEKVFIYQILHNSQEPVHIVVRRKKLASSRAVFPIHIYRSGDRDRELGINLEPGLYVSRIISGSLAAKEGNLAVGDRILNINGFSLENRSTSEAMRLLSEAGDHVVLNVLRYCQTPTSSLVSSMSMFSGTNFDGYSDGGGFRSPHDPAWKTPTEELHSDAGKLAGNATLKSSGSQTDGLDSHHGDLQLGYEMVPTSGAFQRGAYVEGQELHEKNLFDKAIDVIARPFRSNRAVRDVRSKSTHPFVNSSVIDAWRCQEDSPSPQNLMDTVPSMPSTAPSTERAKTKSHGTWPKCRVHIDYTFPTESGSRPSWSASRRPHLSQMTRDGSNALPTNPADHKVPPLPPTRRDSFKRSASMKHSPQNSEAAAKYASAKTSVASPGTSHCDNGSLGDTFRSDQASQDYVTDVRPAVSLDCKPKDAGAYPESSRIVSCLCDQEVVRYANSHRTSSRPNASLQRPNRSSQDFSSQGSSASWLSDHLSLPVKPTSLGVQPIYSPRTNQTNQDTGFLWPIASFSPGTSPGSPQVVTNDAAAQKLIVKPSACAPVRMTEPPLYHPLAASSERRQTEQRLPYFSNNMSTVMQMHLMHGSGFGSKPSDSLGSHSTSAAAGGGMRYLPVSPGARASNVPFESMLRSSIPETPDLEQLSSSSNRDVDCSMASSSPSPMVSNLNHRFLPPSSSSLSHQQENELQRKLSSVFSQHPGHQFQERIRIPSSPSIVSSKSSGGAMSSPSSYDPISEYLSYAAPPYTLPNRHHRHQPVPNCNSLPKMTHEKSKRARPRIGETRSIAVEMSHEPLGIQIDSGRDGGIFVSAVVENSRASRAGLEVGDQLLEVCGINMRCATKQLASSVLRQCSDGITMLVQYNPDKYHDQNLSDSDDPPSEDDESRDNFNRGSNGNRVRASNATITPETFMTHMTFGHSSRTPEESSSSPEPRVVVRKKLHPHDSVGLELVGGNAVGIFVKNVLPGSALGGPKGVGIGDQILEFNNKDFRGLTLEQAIMEVNKPCEQVVCCVQYSFPMFLRTETQAGDAFYVQALYSRSATGDSELSFERGDKLFIENTVLSGRMGTWWAYLVNENGEKLKCGTIPSKTKLEEELLHKRSLADISSSCQTTTSGPVRRSFFHRHRHRHNSRDGHELSSFSDASLNSDSVHHLDDLPLPTLERIEKFDNSISRPILITGAFAEQVVKKLTSESPDKFCRHDTDMTLSNEEPAMVEYRTASDGIYRVISILAIQQIMKQNRHCLLTVPPETVEKLQKACIYPIVLFIKYKSQKQIRDMKDARFIPEKVSSKMAKDLFEQGQEYELKYKRIFSETIPGGNLASICCEIKQAIDREQKKTLWIPVTTGN